MDDSTSYVSPFERIRQASEEGGEYWSARDLAKVLDYLEYRNFLPVIAKAQIACANSGQRVDDHFVHFHEMVAIGSKARRRIEDVHLSRYACYLIVQNADPSKEIVALGQTYFAIQTRRQEEADQLASLSEDQKRLYLRGQLTDHNRHLAAAASQAGVVAARDFAIFQDHGYMGLYGGMKARDIHVRKELKKSQQILDHMGSESLPGNADGGKAAPRGYPGQARGQPYASRGGPESSPDHSGAWGHDARGFAHPEGQHSAGAAKRTAAAATGTTIAPLRCHRDRLNRSSPDTEPACGGAWQAQCFSIRHAAPP